MALHDITDLQYLIPRTIIWCLVFLIALYDAVRNIKRSSFRRISLFVGVVISLFCYVVQDILLLTYSVLSKHNNPVSGDVRKSYYVFSDLADAVFMGLLLLIAAGYCITRDNLGPYKAKVLATPVIYFATKVTTDIIIDVVEGSGKDIVVTDFDPWTWFVLYIAQVVSLMAFLLALVFIFEIVAREVEAISTPREGIIGARDVENGLPVSNPAGTSQAAGEAETAQGHAVSLPPEVAENGQPLSEVYAEVTAEDHDAPKTVEETMQHRTKVRLMRQFSWAAAACVICYVVALILPLFYYSEPGEEDAAVLVVLILWNVVKLVFLAGLCFIFRVREDNPYLLLEEEGGLDTDFSSGEVRTELGVLSSDKYEETEQYPEHINHNYSLGDEEEEDVAPPKRRIKANQD